MAVREDVARGVVYDVGKGKKIRFWHDVWRGNCPLKIVCHEIFGICNQKEWSVFKVLKHGSVDLTFRSNFGEFKEQE
jgi:hypothetical protein